MSCPSRSFFSLKIKQYAKNYSLKALALAALAYLPVLRALDLYEHLATLDAPPMRTYAHYSECVMPPSVAGYGAVFRAALSVAEWITMPDLLSASCHDIHLPSDGFQLNTTLVCDATLMETLAANFHQATGAVVATGHAEVLVVDKDPVVIKKVMPVYPDLARRSGLEGTVLAKVWVNTEGHVKQAIIIQCSSKIFEQPVLDAVKQWTFTPAYMNNQPISQWVKIPINFRLGTAPNPCFERYHSSQMDEPVQRGVSRQECPSPQTHTAPLN